jgi:hypothetical protein
VRKPEVRFYEIACALVGANPTECVFLDDLGINLKPAAAMGMTTIKMSEDADADGDEDEKTPSSKKTINISYEPENYKKNRAKSLDNLIAMLMKKEPVNEDNGAIDLDVDADTEAPDEEERKKLLKKIANSLGTGENIAGINPFETEASKQPSKFKKLFKQMLKKNKTNKEK